MVLHTELRDRVLGFDMNEASIAERPLSKCAPTDTASVGFVGVRAVQVAEGGADWVPESLLALIHTCAATG